MATGHKVGAALVAHPGRADDFLHRRDRRRGGDRQGRRAALQEGRPWNWAARTRTSSSPTPTSTQSCRRACAPAFDNQGEICLCGSRIFVESSVYPQFVERFIAATRQLKVGDPLDPAVDQGALISHGHLRKGACRTSDLAEQEGGRILCGGGPLGRLLGERCKAATSSSRR